jgi:hypothetical protein
MRRVFLVSTPRSHSVCLTRVLEQTQKFTIFHEPYIPVYGTLRYGNMTKDWYKSSAFTQPTEIVAAMNEAQRSSHVLVKDMSFAIVNYINYIIKHSSEDDRFILLTRFPLNVLISFYHKCKQLGCDENFKMQDWRELSGFYQLKEIKDKLITKGRKPLIVSSDDLSKCVLSTFQFLDIPFKPEYTKWNTCREKEEIEAKSFQWRENKKDELFTHWHREALQSKGLHHNMDHFMSEIQNPIHCNMIKRLDDELRSVYNEILK